MKSIDDINERTHQLYLCRLVSVYKDYQMQKKKLPIQWRI